jgi:beta-1,4-mannosyltransferase
MLYHARALADSGARVTLIGRAGSSMPVRFLDDDRIRVKLLPARRPRGMIGAETGRWLLETGRLLVEMVRDAPDVILLQAPPLFPAALAALAASSLCGARFVVDWHNFGDGLLALHPNGSGAPAATLAALERMLGRRADAHLAVSEELAAALGTRRDIPDAHVFRDRPHERFSMPSATEVAAFRSELIRMLGLPFEEPLLLALSPTSWGRDEDLGLLLTAAPLVASSLPPSARPVLLLASGEGEGRPAFEARSATPLRRVAIRTTFVPGDVYPLLVRSADAGISLHKPALGLDPPMKVADLLGGGVPVLELRAGPAPASLVVAGKNGLAFRGPADLAEALVRLASDPAALAELRAGAGASEDLSFRQAWAAEVAPVLLGGVA